MFKRCFPIVICAFAFVLLSCRPAHAQFIVEDPIVDAQIPLEVANTGMQVTAQYTTNAYAYEGFLHDLKDDIVQSEQYTTLANIFTQGEDMLKTGQQAVALAEEAYSAPTVLYNALKVLPTEYKSLATARADTFSLAQPIIELINLGSPGVLEQVGLSSVSSVSIIPAGMPNLDPVTQQHVRSRATTMALQDSMIGSTLQRASDVQAHVAHDQQSLSELESQTFSLDPSQHTELATLQRINTALVMLVRAQQDSNQLNAAFQMKSLVKDQQELDNEKAASSQGQYWQSGIDQLNSTTSDLNTALSYVPQ